MEPIPAAAWRVAAVVTIGSFVAGLDGSLISVGLETLGRQLGTSLTSTQWVSSGYLLAMAATLPACGWLSRRLGAGRLWLWACSRSRPSSAPSHRMSVCSSFSGYCKALRAVCSPRQA